MRGKYIVLEGLDGSGKTTQHQRLLEVLGENVVGVREPGGTPMAEAIRSIVKDGAISRSPRTNMYLFSAARADLADNVIRPTVQKGGHVLADRNWLSMIAGQSAEGVKNIEEMYQLSRAASAEFFEPDLLIFLDADVATTRTRQNHRRSSKQDYFEGMPDQFFTKQRDIYLEHVTKLRRYAIIDGDQTPHKVTISILKELKAVLDIPTRAR